MMRTQLPKPLRQILASTPYATIATVCKDGQPWNTPVFARWDDSLAMYWVSHKNAQHSQNIAREPRIFVVVYDSTVPEGEGLGMYLTVRAKLLTAPQEIARAKRVYDTSFFSHEFASHKQFLAGCPQGFYKAVSERVWHNVDKTQEDHFVDAREEIFFDGARVSVCPSRG